MSSVNVDIVITEKRISQFAIRDHVPFLCQAFLFFFKLTSIVVRGEIMAGTMSRNSVRNVRGFQAKI